MFLSVDNTKQQNTTLPRNCTFRESDWHILASFWHPVLFSSELEDKPVAAKLLDVNIVVYRTSQGVRAARDLCRHRGAALSLGWISEDQLVCPMHGLHYNSEGKCTKIPCMPDQSKPISDRFNLEMYQVKERYGLIWVCIKPEAIAPLPEWPFLEADPDNWVIKQLPIGEWKASAPRHVENFNDMSHLSWVHAKTFGNREQPEIPLYNVEQYENALEYQIPYPEVWTREDGSKVEAPMNYRTRIDFPFASALTIKKPDDEILYRVHDVASPMSAKQTRIFQITSISKCVEDWIIEDYPLLQGRVNLEDVPIVESQCPEELPLDLREEMNISADLISYQYRKKLAEKFGLGSPITA